MICWNCKKKVPKSEVYGDFYYCSYCDTNFCVDKDEVFPGDKSLVCMCARCKERIRKIEKRKQYEKSS